MLTFKINSKEKRETCYTSNSVLLLDFKILNNEIIKLAWIVMFLIIKGVYMQATRNAFPHVNTIDRDGHLPGRAS